MEEFERLQHIDFVWRSRHPDANMPKGYWFITEISIPISTTVWRKTSKDAWRMLAESNKALESECIRVGTLKKTGGEAVYAAGSLKERLDSELNNYMKKNKLNKFPYIYWNQTGSEN